MRHLRPKSLRTGMTVLMGVRGECEIVTMRQLMWAPNVKPYVRYDITFKCPDGSRFAEIDCVPSDSFSVTS